MRRCPAPDIRRGALLSEACCRRGRSPCAFRSNGLHVSRLDCRSLGAFRRRPDYREPSRGGGALRVAVLEGPGCGRLRPRGDGLPPKRGNTRLRRGVRPCEARRGLRGHFRAGSRAAPVRRRARCAARRRPCACGGSAQGASECYAAAALAPARRVLFALVGAATRVSRSVSAYQLRGSLGIWRGRDSPRT